VTEILYFSMFSSDISLEPVQDLTTLQSNVHQLCDTDRRQQTELSNDDSSVNTTSTESTTIRSNFYILVGWVDGLPMILNT